MTSTLVRVSRLPVGSSARRMRGLFTSARAMATRCCWPPESWFGWWSRALGEPDARERLASRARAARGARSARVEERQLDVLERARARRAG